MLGTAWLQLVFQLLTRFDSLTGHVIRVVRIIKSNAFLSCINNLTGVLFPSLLTRLRPYSKISASLPVMSPTLSFLIPTRTKVSSPWSLDGNKLAPPWCTRFLFHSFLREAQGDRYVSKVIIWRSNTCMEQRWCVLPLVWVYMIQLAHQTSVKVLGIYVDGYQGNKVLHAWIPFIWGSFQICSLQLLH